MTCSQTQMIAKKIQKTFQIQYYETTRLPDDNQVEPRLFLWQKWKIERFPITCSQPKWQKTKPGVENPKEKLDPRWNRQASPFQTRSCSISCNQERFPVWSKGNHQSPSQCQGKRSGTDSCLLLNTPWCAPRSPPCNECTGLPAVAI